jgi:hypothetical protein
MKINIVSLCYKLIISVFILNFKTKNLLRDTPAILQILLQGQ